MNLMFHVAKDAAVLLVLHKLTAVPDDRKSCILRHAGSGFLPLTAEGRDDVILMLNVDKIGVKKSAF